MLGILFLPRIEHARVVYAVLLLIVLVGVAAAAYLHSVDLYIAGNYIALVAMIAAFLLLGTLLSRRFEFMENLILSLIVLFGVVTTYIVHTKLHLAENGVVFVLLCMGLGAGLFAAFDVIDERRWGGVALSAVALLGLVGVYGGVPVLSSDDPVIPDRFAESDYPVAPDRFTESDDIVESKTRNIRNISFVDKPNIYFVSFDALSPRALIDKHLDLETTEFHDLFDVEFRRFPNFFANAVATGPSFSVLMSLDENSYLALTQELGVRGGDNNPLLLSGQNPSPLASILRNNGYETSFIFANTYFGEQKGHYIDNYIQFSQRSTCALMDSRIRSVSFWGYCRFFSAASDGAEFMTERIIDVSGNNGTQFAFAYFYLPTHTPQSFRYDDSAAVERYRSSYSNRSKEAAEYLERIVRHLEENDPNAILFVFGDHGPFLSNGLEFEDDPVFYIQDRYGVLGGVYPPDTCALWFDDMLENSHGYTTILDAVHTILRCLSDGESALVEPAEYEPGGWHRGYPGNTSNSYEEFIYE